MFSSLFTTPVGHAFYLLLISMLPVVELRGSIPAAAMLDVPWLEAYVLCVIGNMLPVPFLILCSRKIFTWLKRGPLRELVAKVERRIGKKSETVKKYRTLGLFILVMIPLPGTGAWTGSFVASALNMRMKSALPAIFFGVLAAGAITTVVSYGLLG